MAWKPTTDKGDPDYKPWNDPTFSKPTDEEMAARKEQWEREQREPSPLPWTCKPHDSYMREDEEEPIEIIDASGETVADNVSYYAHHIKVADARFIVQCVNVHDALVAALEEARELLRPHGYATTEIDAALAMARKGG